MAFHCIHCRSEIDPKYKACPYCGEPITEFLRRYLESPIDGKYQILARLGVGGMGEVFKVLHIHLNAIRVIKMMRANIAQDASAHERFLREARLATRIQHPSVAALFDFSTLEDGSRYMVWEYIEGINLHELIDSRGPLSPRYAAKLAAQALHGLDAIHRAGIVHRDVSPENLMITRDDEGDERVKIIDLGIAKQWGDEADNKTKTGMFVGKWKYCSPEHLGMLGEGERIDGRADIYSFGIVLYEMLTGVPPFQADTPHGYLLSHASERPRSLRETNPSVTASPELEALLFRSMEKDRRNRFATAREFAQALEQLIPTLDDTAGAPAPLPVAAESTDEATRHASDRIREENKATIISTQRADPMAATLKTVESGPIPKPSVPRPRSVVTHGPKPKRGVGRWLALLAVMIAFGLGGYAMWRSGVVDGVQQAAMTTTTRASVLPPPRQTPTVVPTGHLGINAFPWANVTSIRNVETRQQVPLGAGLVTPAPVDLAPGRYEVTLSNPSFGAPVTRTVEIRSGEEETLNVALADADRAALPSLGGSVP
ncbi:MAG TPA: protein kinase [Thermoanaerobaculia bacterium]|jgi:serine/threonine-protein kinase|nr:protein kinase [Thermoanaerobaculia bacterium]